MDSAIAWWASIQPSWRTFEHGKVSHRVQGGWDILHSPRINGLLVSTFVTHLENHIKISKFFNSTYV